MKTIAIVTLTVQIKESCFQLPSVGEKWIGILNRMSVVSRRVLRSGRSQVTDLRVLFWWLGVLEHCFKTDATKWKYKILIRVLIIEVQSYVL